MIKEKAVVIEPSFVIEDFRKKTPEEQIEMCGRLCYKSEEQITIDSAIGFVTEMIENRHNAVLEMATKTFFVNDPDYFTSFEHWEMSLMKYLVVDDYDNGLIITGSIRAFREAFAQLKGDKLFVSIAICIWKEHPTLFADQVEILEAFDLIDFVSDRNFEVRELSSFEFEELHRKDAELYFRHKHVAVRFIVSRAVTYELVRHRLCSFLQESQQYCLYSQDKFDNRVTFIKPVFYEKGSDEYDLWEHSVLQAEKTYLKLLETSTPQAARTVLPNSCKAELIIFCSLKQWGHLFHVHTSKHAELSIREVMVPLYEEFIKQFSGVAHIFEEEHMPEKNRYL
ncbi:MAG: FAD-dependent thymidylate synthase [Candidatus Moraniibacteriota bacterium]|nr:MAG: FAD-dependent thymidylate synthase [Candidatus Moranbacteria bacterium]